MKIRNLQAKDRAAIKELLINTAVFKDIEVDCGLELIDLALGNPAQEDYYFLVAVSEDDKALGYICYGKTPLTDAVYDLYWIAVKPSSHRKNIGENLLKRMEELLKNENARMVLAETSSLPHYEAARNFYKKNGFSVVSEVFDFYSVGDNKITFRKDL